MKKNLDITKPRYCKQILPVPWLVTWRFFFKCITITWVIKRVCYTLWTSLNRGFHCIIFSFQLLTDLGPSNLTSFSPLLIYYIYILPQPHYLLFDPPLPTWLITSFCSRFLLFAVGLLVSPVAYNPETSKFPIFTCLEKCWVFYF